MANEDRFQQDRRDSARRLLYRKRNPLANWRWWVALPLTLAIAVLAALCIALKALGEISEQCGEIIQLNTLRPLIRWTWGNDDEGESHGE